MADNWQLKAVLSAVDQMSPVLKSVSNVAKTTRKYLSDVAGAASGLTSKVGLPLTALSGILGGFSAVAIKNAVIGFTDMGEALYKSSLRTGMSVEQLQRMKYVAEQSGVPIEALEGGIGKLNRNIGMAAAGKSKDLAALMQKLGISTRDANGQLKSGIDILPQLSDAFVRNKNPVVQARMGMALFGKSWQEMVPLLMEGADGINSSLDRFKRLKGVMNLDDLKGAKELGDKFKDLEFVTKGFQNTIAKELVPVLAPLIEDIVQWAAANRKVMSTGVKEFVRDLVAGMRQIDWSAVIEGAKNFARSLGTLVDWIGGARNALILLAVVMNAQTIMAIAGLIGALGRAGIAFLIMAANAYIAGNASLLSLMRVAAVALFTAGPIGVLGAAFTWLAGIAAGASGLISGAMGAVSLAIRGVGAALMANPLGIILALATAAYLIYQNWDTLKAWFSSFFDWIGEKFQKVVGWAVDLAHSVGSFFGGDSSARAATNAGSALNGERQSLVGPASQVKASGQIEVSFKDAPQGMRVEQAKVGGDVPINTNVGYRSYATGMP
jgi:hypothetical protein